MKYCGFVLLSVLTRECTVSNDIWINLKSILQCMSRFVIFFSLIYSFPFLFYKEMRQTVLSTSNSNKKEHSRVLVSSYFAEDNFVQFILNSPRDPNIQIKNINAQPNWNSLIHAIISMCLQKKTVEKVFEEIGLILVRQQQQTSRFDSSRPKNIIAILFFDSWNLFNEYVCCKRPRYTKREWEREGDTRSHKYMRALRNLVHSFTRKCY